MQNTNFQDTACPVDPQQLDPAIPLGVSLFLLWMLSTKKQFCVAVVSQCGWVEAADLGIKQGMFGGKAKGAGGGLVRG